MRQTGFSNVFEGFDRFDEDVDPNYNAEHAVDESDPLSHHPDAPDFLELTRVGLNGEKDQTVAFPLYNDSDLPFLDQNTEIGRKIGKSIVHADFDDDCATDDEM